MIGIINMPPESPAEYYEQRPLRNGETSIFNEQKRSKTPMYFFAPDGRSHGLQFQQSQSAESLWEETLQRSLVCRLGREEARRRSISCSDVNDINEIQQQSPVQTKEAEDVPRSPNKSGHAKITTPLSQVKSRPHRKSTSPLARASAFFSKSLPKITQLK